MPCDYKKYPKDWKEIRKRILERDKHCCKMCGVYNYSVVHWDKENAEYIIAGGNRTVDEVGSGECGYTESRIMADFWNEADGGKYWIVIVLTIMHLDHDTTNNSDDNLAAACQRCHLAYDQKLHMANAKATRNKKKGVQLLF